MKILMFPAACMVSIPGCNFCCRIDEHADNGRQLKRGSIMKMTDDQKQKIETLRRQGMCLRTMFGYRICKEAGIEIDPEQAGIVREIYARIIRGDTLNSITRWLNRNGLYGSFGGKWNTARIRDLVSNEKYTGNSLLQKAYVNNHIEKKRIRNRGELPQYYATETHPAIIDQETFDAAQDALARIAASHAPGKPAERHAFTGMIVCLNCGKHFKRVKNHGLSRWACSFRSVLFQNTVSLMFSTTVPT